MSRTFMANAGNIEHAWFIVDAEGKTLGRLASEVASVLRGKHKPTYTPHVDCGDNVIIINANKVVLTGKKMEQKIYYNHSRHVGGLRKRTAETMIERYPVEMVERAIVGMLPHNRLGRAQAKKLFVYEGAEHKHEAQQPKTLEV